MISRILYWRAFTKDRIFLVLFATMIVTFLIALSQHDSNLERNAVPLQLGITFLIINFLFAILTLRREPLLSYMFLTASILLNGTLLFFFHYLKLIQSV